MQLVLASTNTHKRVEIDAILAGTGITVVGLGEFPEIPEPPETGETFEENAIQKARFVFECTGLPTLADDSGLEVDALGGAPGVRSKRFSPEETAEANNALLLRRLEGVADRRARFRCVLAVVARDLTFTCAGAVEGRIAAALRGAGGFGYDPLFLPDEVPGRAMAELSMGEKNAISHRGRALAALVRSLRDGALVIPP